MNFWWMLVVLSLFFVFAVKAYLIITCGRYKIRKSLAGKVVLITGGTGGIGVETARELARAGAKIFILCRDVHKGRVVADEIMADTGNDKVYVRHCDLHRLVSVRECAQQFLLTDEPIHVLINNAGASGKYLLTSTTTEDGLNDCMQANHFGHFMLTNLLLDRIIASAPARIVNLSSIAHHFAFFFDVNKLKLNNGGYGLLAYPWAKLGNILFTKALAKRLVGTDVVVNVVHPGVVATNFGQAAIGGFVWPLWLAVRQFLIKTPAEGAHTTLYLAVDDAVAHVSGKYFVDCKETMPSAAACDEQLAERFWQKSVELTGCDRN